MRSDPQGELRIGIVGLGDVAENWLLPALQKMQGARLWSVTSRSLEKAETFAERFGAACAFADYDDMIRDPHLDAVVIAAPDVFHSNLALRALQEGKHVFVEKPMATEIEDARLMIVASKHYGTRLVVGYHLRHHQGHRALKRYIEAEGIGIPEHAEISWSYRAPQGDWRARNDLARWWALAAVGTHAIDLACWFLGEGEEIPAVSAECRHQDGFLEHSAKVSLAWKNGKRAEIRVSNRETYDRLIVVKGLRGYAMCTNTLGPRGRGVITLNDEVISYTPLDPYEAELADFVQSIMTGRSPEVDGEVGLYNLRILDAVVARVM